VAAASARAAENSAALNARERGAAVELRSSDASPLSSMFAEPGGSGEHVRGTNLNAPRNMPMHTTIGFPPSTDPHFAPIASAHRGAPLSFSGDSRQIWQTSQGATANRNSVRVTGTHQMHHVLPKPPIVIRRPIIGGAPFLISSPGFIFVNPGFGFFGPGFGCDPFFTPSFGCGSFFPFGFGGFGYLGFGGGYGYDGGYYAPPNFDINAPNVGDEGTSQEPAPSEWQNPPAENSSPDNSAAENAAPDTVIYLQDGTSFAVKDYWVADGKLHYVASYGGENAVDLSQLDLQRTTDENAARGISITLRPAPESQPPAQPQPPAANPR
jgi:hypothetical protein